MAEHHHHHHHHAMDFQVAMDPSEQHHHHLDMHHREGLDLQMEGTHEHDHNLLEQLPEPTVPAPTGAADTSIEVAEALVAKKKEPAKVVKYIKIKSEKDKKQISLADKVRIIALLEEKDAPSFRRLADELGVSKSTIGAISRDRAAIRQMANRMSK